MMEIARRVRGLFSWQVLFLIPAAVVFLVFYYVPLIRTGILSTQGTNLFGKPTGFVGLENFQLMFRDGDFLRTLLITVVFTAGTVIGKLAIGLAIAVPLSLRLRGTIFLRTVVLVPMAISVAAAAITFRALFQPASGPINQLLSAVGVSSPPMWLTDQSWALISVIIVDTWFGIGFVTLLLMASLDNIPTEILEAAEIDGAKELRKTLAIRIPLVTPILFFLIVTQSIHALRQFAIIDVLTGGGPNGASKTLVVDIYRAAFGSGTADYGAASARGLILMVIVMAITAVQFLLIERRVHYS